MSMDVLENIEGLYGKLGTCLGNFEICNIGYVKENRDALLGRLTGNEKKLYDNYLREEKKYEFLGGRALVKQCLLKLINSGRDRDLGFLDIDIRREKDGFPVLFVSNVELDEPHFSISHKRDYIFCAADPVSVIGIDVEKIDGKLEKLKSYFLVPDEERIILNHAGGKAAPCRYYTALWASKECIVKCLKKNLWEVFKKVRLTAIKENKFLFKYRSYKGEYDVSSSNFLYDGYVYSVVSLTEQPE